MRRSDWVGSVREEFVGEVVVEAGVIQFVDKWKGLLRGWLVQTGEEEWFESHRCSGRGAVRYWREQVEGAEGVGVVLV